MSQMADNLYPLFKFKNFSVQIEEAKLNAIETPVVQFDLNLNKSHSFKSISIMRPENYNKLIVKFIEKDYSNTSVKLSLN